MAAKNKPGLGAACQQEARPPEAPDPDQSKGLATMALQPSVNAAAVMASYGGPMGIGQDDIGPLVGSLADDIKEMWTGDTKRTEAMLFGQAHALQAIFMNLARRATTQEYMRNCEAYLRMALKAQNQCRMTLETLATIKNPPVVYAQQANINNGGQQQVNNSVAPAPEKAHTHAAKVEIAPTELLEQQHGEWLDTGAAGQAGGADPHLAPVGKVHRTEKR